MSPYEEAANDEIRSLFRRPLETNASRFADDNTDTRCLGMISEKETDEVSDNIPNGWITGYKNIGKYSRSKDIKLIVRAQIIKYYLARLKRSNDCARELQSILKHNVLSNDRNYKTARLLFDEYCSGNQGTLIAIKTLTSTSVDPKVDYDFARGQQTDNKGRHRVICEFQFDPQCSTAIDLPRNDAKKLLCLSAYPDKVEVLVLPGTLFEVRDVRQAADTGRYTIVLHNVYVPLNVILDAFKEAEV